jgi:nitric oxide dioxygenase
MFPPRTVDIVKATAPVLEEHGETLTEHFYKRMFSRNPRLLRCSIPPTRASAW